MKILIIDNYIDRENTGAKPIVRYARMAPGALIHVRRGPERDLPRDPSGYDRIIVSGSRASAMEEAPWISDLLDFLKRAIDLHKPMLGICYGHQALARVLGGKAAVRRSPTPEFGWTDIEVLKKSALLEGLPGRFVSFSAHNDEAIQIPAGVVNLARSERCAIQAFQIEGEPVFGIQFHPEKSLEDAQFLLDIIKKKEKAKPLLRPEKGRELYDPKIAEVIFGNFFKL